MEFVCWFVRQGKNANVLSLWPSLSFSQRIFIEFFRESDLRFSSIYYDEEEDGKAHYHCHTDEG